MYESDEEVLYGYNNSNRRNNSYKSNSKYRPGGNFTKSSSRKGSSYSFNAPDRFGNPRVCDYCHSMCHFVLDCPDCPEHLKRQYKSSGSFHVSDHSEYL